MPVIVVGADTELGSAIVAAASERRGEIRAFVTDEGAAAELRARSIKVALGDVSDWSHVGAAAIGCFSAVLVGDAARDGRPMAFGSDPDEIVASWVVAALEAAVTRIVLVDGEGLPRAVEALDAAPESAVVGPAGAAPEETARRVILLDESASL